MEIKFEVKKIQFESEMSVLNDQISELKDQLSSKIQSEIKQNLQLNISKQEIKKLTDQIKDLND